MEVLTGDRQQQQQLQEFSTHMSPLFSETEQELVVLANSSRAAVHHHHEPPQKLRIRCNGRSSTVIDADPIAQFRLGSAADYGVSPGSYDQHFEAQCGEFVTWKRKRKRTSSSTTSTRTRRRSKRLERLERVEHFVQSLVNKMVEKQEEMHMQLIQMVQDKEKERIAKEEAWKQHELDRIARDEELRAQETSRSLALINFVHNLLGSEAPHIPQPPPPPVATTVSTQSLLGIGVQIPQPPLASQVAQPVANIPVQNLVGMCIQVRQPPPRIEQPVAAVTPTPTDNRWLQAEVRALIAMRASLEHKFHIPRAGSESPIPCATKALWDDVSLGMKGMGFDRTAGKCREKWENMNKYFKRAMAGDKKRSENAKTCHYFKELECFYKNGLLNMGNVFSPTSSLGNGFSPTNIQNEFNSEKETEHSILSKVDTPCSTIPSVLNSNEAAELLTLMVSL